MCVSSLPRLVVYLSDGAQPPLVAGDPVFKKATHHATSQKKMRRTKREGERGNGSDALRLARVATVPRSGF